MLGQDQVAEPRRRTGLRTATGPTLACRHGKLLHVCQGAEFAKIDIDAGLDQFLSRIGNRRAKSIGQADATARPSREVDVRDERRVLLENITTSPFPAAAKVGKISVLLMIEPSTPHKCLDRGRLCEVPRRVGFFPGFREYLLPQGDSKKPQVRRLRLFTFRFWSPGLGNA